MLVESERITWKLKIPVVGIVNLTIFPGIILLLRYMLGKSASCHLSEKLPRLCSWQVDDTIRKLTV